MATRPTGMIFQPTFFSSGMSLPKDRPASVSVAVAMERKSTVLMTVVRASAPKNHGLEMYAPIVVI